MSALRLTLVFNAVTLAVAVVAAIKRPIKSYFAIAAVALCAAGLSLYQALTGRENVFVLLSTILLVALMTWRIRLDLSGVRRQGGAMGEPPRRASARK